MEQTLSISFDSLLRGLLGVLTLLVAAWLMSSDRKRIDWKLVGGGLFLEIVIVLAVLFVPFRSA